MVYDQDVEKRLSVEEIKYAFESYPGVFTLPPEERYLLFDDYDEPESLQNFVEFDLWYDDSVSDLTLSLTIGPEDEYSIEDIHVL